MLLSLKRKQLPSVVLAWAKYGIVFWYFDLLRPPSCGTDHYDLLFCNFIFQFNIFRDWAEYYSYTSLWRNKA